MRQHILVWDIPTRVFHWLLVLSFTGAYLTAEVEVFPDMHAVLGYTMMGLLAFRLPWGFIGTRYARFHSFIFMPAEIMAYIRSLLTGKAEHFVGHNPAGSVAIWLLLSLGILSGVTGILLIQDIGGEAMEEIHEFFSNSMLVVVLIHIAGVAVSSVLHRENLARSMVTGLKTAEPGQGIRYAHRWLGVIMIIAVLAFWVGYPSTGLVTQNADTAHAEHDDDDD